MSIEYRGETFSGYNKPKNDRTKTKKFSVLAKSGDTIKLIRYGDANMTIKKTILKIENHLELDTNAIPRKVY
jgi:hypothetical protein